MKKIVEVLLLLTGMCWAGEDWGMLKTKNYNEAITAEITDDVLLPLDRRIDPSRDTPDDTIFQIEPLYRKVCKIDTIGWESQMLLREAFSWKFDWPGNNWLIYYGHNQPDLFDWRPLTQENCHFEPIQSKSNVDTIYWDTLIRETQGHLSGLDSTYKDSVVGGK
jgi:hypothetical protein